MNKFHNRSGMKVVIARITKRSCREQDDERPQAFTAAINNIMGDAVNQRDIALQVLDNLEIYGGPVAIKLSTDGVEVKVLR